MQASLFVSVLLIT